MSYTEEYPLAIPVLAAVILFSLLSLCSGGSGQGNKHSDVAPTSTPMNTPATDADKAQPTATGDDGLKRIYDSATERRDAVDKAVSESSNPVRVDNNTEAPKLEEILKHSGWSSPTVTEGVKEHGANGYVWKLEVIDGEAQDWYVLMKTDTSITSGSVEGKRKGSPW